MYMVKQECDRLLLGAAPAVFASLTQPRTANLTMFLRRMGRMRFRLCLLLSLFASGTWPGSFLSWLSWGRPTARIGGLHSYWIGTPELLVCGCNPYGPEVPRKSDGCGRSAGASRRTCWPMPNHGGHRPTLISVFSDQRRTRSTT